MADSIKEVITAMLLDNSSIRKLADEWYAALQRHAALNEVTEFLVDEGFEMRLPEGVLHGRSDFATWYELVTNRFFDERQAITGFSADVDGDEASVALSVNWQARTWTPPEPTSEWIGFDVNHTWVVVPDRDGAGAKIKTYAINGLTPMPGSASL